MHMSRLFSLVVTVSVLMAATPMVAQEPKDDSKAANKLVGTWKLVSAKYGGKESTRPETATTIKHVTTAQFMWVTYDKDGQVTFGAGGGYTLKGDEYTETPEYVAGAPLESFKGPHTFKWKVEGNKWHHVGKLATGLAVDEVWERVEKK